jgi:hypothetical protein
MPDHWLRLHRCTHHDERRGGYGFFARLMGLIDACMMDGRNELTDAFFSFYCSLARFWSRSLYGKKPRNVFTYFFFWLFFGHEDYGMPFSVAPSNLSSSWLIVDVDVGYGVLVVVWFVVFMSVMDSC